MLAASDYDGGTYLWSIARQTGHQISSPPGLAIWALSFSVNGTLAIADDNGHAYLWRINTANLATSPAGVLTDPGSGSQGIGALSFSPDGKWLVTGDTNGTAYVWKTGTTRQ